MTKDLNEYTVEEFREMKLFGENGAMSYIQMVSVIMEKIVCLEQI